MTPWAVPYQTPPPMGFSRQDTGVGCHFLLQGIFPTQGLNLGLQHCRQMLHHLSHHRSPVSREQYNSNFTRSLPCVPDFSKLAKFFPNVPKTLHRNFLFPLKLTLLVDGAAGGGFLWLSVDTDTHHPCH